MAIQKQDSELKAIDSFVRGLPDLTANVQVSITVPSTVNYWLASKKHTLNLTSDQHKDIYENVLSAMSAIFGGARVTFSYGAWVDEHTSKLVREDTAIVSSYAIGAITPAQLQAVHNLAKDLRVSFGQDAVLLEISAGSLAIFEGLR